MDTQRLVLTKGLPGAGKSTWAREWVAEDSTKRARINRDDLRVMVFGKKGGQLNPSQEHTVTLMVSALTREALRSGRSVVIDATNLRPKYIKEFILLAEEEGCKEIQEVLFDIPVEQAIQRQRHRPMEDQVPESVIRDMANKFVPRGKFLEVEWNTTQTHSRAEKYVAKENARPVVICDLDGTLAHMNGRSPYDFSQVGGDSLNPVVAHVLNSVRTYLGWDPIFVSGRDDSCYDLTEKWLSDNSVVKEGEKPTLFMRKTGDDRKDSIVKLEIFNKHIRNNYDVQLVLDDRNQVVQMWRQLGIPTFQVAEGNF